MFTLDFSDSKARWVGGIAVSAIDPVSPLQLRMPFCNPDTLNFPTNPPTETEKIWRITLTRPLGIALLTIHCNDEEVASVLMADSPDSWCWLYRDGGNKDLLARWYENDITSLAGRGYGGKIYYRPMKGN
jgi:hypothetical protein